MARVGGYCRLRPQICAVHEGMTMEPTSVKTIDLTPIAGKTYFDFDREWGEEFIYFLMTDRFQSSAGLPPISQAGRTFGVQVGDGFHGGTIRGVIDNLEYIAGLGCTAIWLSPVLEANSYHGYDITNYLGVAPNFGTKDDLVEL